MRRDETTRRPDDWVLDMLRNQREPQCANSQTRPQAVKPIRLPGGCLLYRLPVRLRMR
jgi:hypothetical protein